MLRKAYQNVKLTNREYEVAKLVMKGEISAKSIAKALKISSRTVEHFIHEIKQKLKCPHKYELIKYLKNYFESINELP